MTAKPAGDDAPKAVFRTFSSRSEADIVSNALAGAGIESFVVSDDCGSVDPALTFVRGVRILVAEEDYDRAEALLESGDTFAADDESPPDASSI